MNFSRVPQCATAEIDSDISQGLEPYDFTSLKPFSRAYLAGIDARAIDIDENVGFETVARRVSNTLDRYLADAEKYQYLSISRRNYEIKQKSARLALMPVWSMEVAWRGKRYAVTMNGQNGALICDVPKSKFKLWLYLVASCAMTFSISLMAYMPLVGWFENHIQRGELLLIADAVLSAIVSWALYAVGTVRLFRTTISSAICFICYLLISVPVAVWAFNRHDMFDLLKYAGFGAHLVVCAVATAIVASYIRDTSGRTARKFRYEADDYQDRRNCAVNERKVDFLWEKTSSSAKSLIGGANLESGFTDHLKQGETGRGHSDAKGDEQRSDPKRP